MYIRLKKHQSNIFKCYRFLYLLRFLTVENRWTVGTVERTYPNPEPVYVGWSSVHYNGMGMTLVDPVYTLLPLGDPASTCRVQ